MTEKPLLTLRINPLQHIIQPLQQLKVWCLQSVVVVL